MNARRRSFARELAEDVFALVCMLAGFAGLTLLCVGMAGP